MYFYFLLEQKKKKKKVKYIVRDDNHAFLLSILIISIHFPSSLYAFIVSGITFSFLMEEKIIIVLMKKIV
jgi:hypothetical protein